MVRMRKHPVFEYMAFAKTYQGRGACNLICSGVPPRSSGSLPFQAKNLPLNSSEPYGLGDLKKAVAERHGVSEEEVFLSTGTSGVNFFLAAVLLGPGDEAVVESPAYPILALLPEVFGAHAVRWPRTPEDRYRPDPESLLPLLTERTRAVFLTDPHNPSGVKLRPRDLETLVGITGERDIPLVVDEVYLDAVEDASTVRRLGGATVSTSSLTKVYGLGGLRVGWALAPAAVVESLNRFQDLASVNPPVPSQALAAIAFGEIEVLRKTARDRFAENFPRVRQWVETTDGVTWVPPEGPLFAFPRLTGGVSGSDLFDLLVETYDTVIVPGRYFDGMDDHFRIGFGEEPGVVEEGLRRIGEAIRTLGG